VRFEEELLALGGKFYAGSTDDATQMILGMLADRGIHEILSWDEDTLPDKMLMKLRTAGIQVMFPTSENIRANSHIRAGLSGVTAAIAETGSILVTSGAGRPLAASLLPEIHIALLREKDVFSNLDQVLHMTEVRQASVAVIVSGPSRTADIEMTLTIGVHGPGELHVICLKDE
jgi:L-lactate dehydrogenase complex protein LldG